MIEASKIKNSTLAKLDRHEIGALGLYSKGIMTYKGTLKSRKQGWKTEKVNEYQTNFVGEHTTIEFIQIVASGDEPEYAMRVRRNAEDMYETDVMPLWGVDYFKH